MSSPSLISYFGYGSLVNLATLRTDFVSAHPAVLSGWQRVWLPRPAHAQSFGFKLDLAFLSVEPCETSKINGMVIVDRESSLPDLDRREELYTRQTISEDSVTLENPASSSLGDTHYLYAVLDGGKQPDPPQILRSYLDAVLQGFHVHWGEPGIAAFKTTTRNCHYPIFEDRDAPVYPRNVVLTDEETHAIERHFPVNQP